MNYFSHYYILPDYKNPFLTLGSILPDMLREKKIDHRLYQTNTFSNKNVHFNQISKGIYFHINSDIHFHNSLFFKNHTGLISKFIKNNPDISIKKYTYFIAHILLELYIDHLLIKRQKALITLFYRQLESLDINETHSYFREYLPANDFELFRTKISNFVQSKYLMQYTDIEKILGFLNYILKKVNIDQLSNKSQELLVDFLNSNYKQELDSQLPKLFSELKNRL